MKLLQIEEKTVKFGFSFSITHVENFVFQNEELLLIPGGNLVKKKELFKNSAFYSSKLIFIFHLIFDNVV